MWAYRDVPLGTTMHDRTQASKEHDLKNLPDSESLDSWRAVLRGLTHDTGNLERLNEWLWAGHPVTCQQISMHPPRFHQR